MDQEIKQCQNCHGSFIIESEDFQFYEKIKVPPPTFCPDCRLQRRLVFRNERSLHKDTCDLCGKSIISMYSSLKPYKVYCPPCYYSDKWNPLDYGREYNFSKPFFAQFQELEKDVPQLGLLQENSVNSPWINYELDDKNCYLNFGGHYNEDCAYNQYALKAKNCFDNYWLMHGEFCYETILCEKGYKVWFSKFCYDCRDTYFSFDCRNCSNVIGCSGLRHKQYHIFNQPVSKEEYEQFLKENSLNSQKSLISLKNKSEEFIRSQPQRALFIEKSVNSTGNNIYESKNCKLCWSAEKTEDSKYILFTLDVKDSMDTTSVWGAELTYESFAGAEQISNLKFSHGILKGCVNIEYSHMLIGCSNCFGCSNLKSKNYHILNKEYPKDEFESLVKRIKKHMVEMPYIDQKGRVYKYGEFFPYDLSHFGYNESVANEYFLLKEDAIIQKGFNSGNDEVGTQYEFSNYEIPDNIKNTQDDILEKVLKCETSGKAYKLIPMELQFYRRFGLPVPKLAPFERHRLRMNFIADHMKLNPRKCFGCNKTTESVYGEKEFPKIYCEECYMKSIY
ncbi:MAG: hypothetical protein Q7R86_02770 [bacterium]|nr:hypothetical protein [bacterium]